jgi:spermidine synthase
MNKQLHHVILLLFTWFTFSISLTSYAETIHSERSLYRNITVDDQGDLRCLRFHTQQQTSHQSCVLKSHPNQLVFSYTKATLAALFVQPNPNKILIIGLGGGTLSNTLQQLLPNASIDNVELDEAVVKVARQYFGYLENDNIHTIIQDGRLFVKRQLSKNQHYDLIILDAFNGDYIPEHLLTQEFLQECQQLLSPQGVLAANTFSVSRLYYHESATYAKVFKQFYQVKLNQSNNRIILVAPQLPPLAQLKQQALYWHSRLSLFGVDANQLANTITQPHDWPANTRILTDQYSPANLLNQ